MSIKFVVMSCAVSVKIIKKKLLKTHKNYELVARNEKNVIYKGDSKIEFIKTKR